MSVDAATVRRIAHLARIAVTEAEVPHLQGELNAMLAFVEQLSEVDVEGVVPMTSAGTHRLPKIISFWCRKSWSKIAFSSEVGPGSRQENASKKRVRCVCSATMRRP